jgi:hypothetical protein
MQRIKPEQLSATITKYLNEYSEEIDEEVQKDTTSISKQAKEELVRISPVNKYGNRGRHYRDGWTISTQNSKKQYIKKIWNKTDSQLTHLLEFGHHSRNGGWVNAQPHIRPVEDKYKQKFIEELERDIRR